MCFCFVFCFAAFYDLLRLFSPETTSKTTDPSPNGHPAKRASVLGRITETASILQHILDQKIQRKSRFQVSSSTLCQIKITCILILFQCIITVYIFCVYPYVLLPTSSYFFFLASVKDLNSYFKCFTLLVIHWFIMEGGEGVWRPLSFMVVIWR